MVSFYTLVCMGVGRDYSLGGHQWIFPKVFLRGPNVVKFVFYHIGFQTNTNGTRAFMRKFFCGIERVNRFV